MSSKHEHGHTFSDEVKSMEEEETGQEIVNRILNFPNVLALLQSQMNSELILPASVKKIEALKMVQLQEINTGYIFSRT